MCYPPFILMGDGDVLDYRHNGAEWAFWLQGHDALLWVWAGALVFLTAVYAWATVAFGLRFSNLTYRGVLTNGPYAFTRHPAYLSKNTYWWLASLPFLTTSGSAVDAIRLEIQGAAVKQLAEVLFCMLGVFGAGNQAFPNELGNLLGSVVQVVDVSRIDAATKSKPLGETEKAPRQSSRKVPGTCAVAALICTAEQTKHLFVLYVLRVMLPVGESQPRMQRGSR